MPKAQKKSELSFDDMINSNKTVKKTTKAKTAAKEILPVPGNIQTKISDLLKAKKAKKVAESDIKKAESEILPYGLNMRDENGFSGKFQKSYKLGSNDEHINFINANKWSFSENDVDDISDILGDDADDMIIEDKVVKLKSEVFSDPKLQKALIQAVGSRFAEFFETNITHHVSEDFDKKVYDTCTKDSIEDLRVYMKQSKPSLR